MPGRLLREDRVRPCDVRACIGAVPACGDEPRADAPSCPPLRNVMYASLGDKSRRLRTCIVVRLPENHPRDLRPALLPPARASQVVHRGDAQPPRQGGVERRSDRVSVANAAACAGDPVEAVAASQLRRQQPRGDERERLRYRAAAAAIGPVDAGSVSATSSDPAPGSAGAARDLRVDVATERRGVRPAVDPRATPSAAPPRPIRGRRRRARARSRPPTSASWATSMVSTNDAWTQRSSSGSSAE